MPNGVVATDPTVFGASWAIKKEDSVFDSGYAPAKALNLIAPPPSVSCSFPKDLSGFGLAPPPAGYDVVDLPPNAKANVTPPPPPPVVIVSKERKDEAFKKWITKICNAALTIPGVDKMKNIEMPNRQQYIDDCITDQMLMGGWTTVDSFRIAYQRNLKARAQAAADKFKICDKTGLPRSRTDDEVAAFAKELGLGSFDCPSVGGGGEYDEKKVCKGNGACQTFGCQCNAGWTVYDCSLDLNKEVIPPAPAAAPVAIAAAPAPTPPAPVPVPPPAPEY